MSFAHRKLPPKFQLINHLRAERWEFAKIGESQFAAPATARRKEKKGGEKMERLILKAIVRRMIKDAVKKYAKIFGVSQEFLFDLIKETLNETKD